ncbi:MAG: hypothetical protein KDD92_19315 [Caldilineaceae bacterium]|nr:hypothetical protein [Caldilineaceae bacterium]
MSEFEYEDWWALHLRVAKGEPLSEQETTVYESGLTHLEGQPTGDDEALTYLRSLRAAIGRAAALHKELAARSADLDKRIVVLESAYQQQTGQKLDLGSHAPA